MSVGTCEGGAGDKLTRFARVGHEQVRAELLDFVDVCLYLDDGVGGGRVCGEDDIALSGERKRDFHGLGEEEVCGR